MDDAADVDGDAPLRRRITARVGADDATDRVLRSLAPPSSNAGSRWIDESDVSRLHPVERDCVARAVPQRRREFATGRVLLRQLLGTDVAIPVAPSRRPELPAGVRASLAHDDELAVAVVSRDATVRAVGVDVEPATALADDLIAFILRPDELHIDAHLAFTLKEATYKAWSSIGGELLDHHDVRLDVGAGTFDATVLRHRFLIPGRFAQVNGRWLAVATVGGGVASPS